MSNWNLGSADGTLSLSLTANDDNGAIQAPSTVWFQGESFAVTGSWIALSAGRAAASAFSFSGNDGISPNPAFMAASGIMVGPGPNPTSISIDANKALSANGSQEQYVGQLLPNAVFTPPAGGYTVTLDDSTQGTLTLAVLANGLLNPAATWVHPIGGTVLNVRASFIASELSWWGANHHYGSGVWNGSQFSGTWADKKKRKNGTWTASQGK